MGLEDLYREIILDHYRSPRNRGELASPPALRVEGYNPLCGDEIVVYLLVEDGVVSDLRIGGQGCSISQSSASMMSAAVKGRTVAEARAVIRAFKGCRSTSSAWTPTASPSRRRPSPPAGRSR
jgi:nitrogen fixation protein NifU and related proteins